MHVSHNPHYQDEQVVADMTQHHIEEGRTVLQLFQFAPNEQQHSLQLLQLVSPPRNATILSLGSGVSGMERYWKDVRPDLSFTFVNISQPQLDLSVCDGENVLADIETVQINRKFDVIVIAYVLGHVDCQKTLANALAHLAPGGLLVIYDVFDGTEQFVKGLLYDTPSLKEVETFGASNNLQFRTVLQGGFPLSDYMAENLPWIGAAVVPALFVFKSR